MTRLCITTSALAAALFAWSSAQAGTLKQPPMSDFNTAFYNCDNGAAFAVSYDSRAPKTATVTTSNNNRQYTLTRTPVADGVQFTGGGVRFWTDGKAVTVEGTQARYEGCKLKSS